MSEEEKILSEYMSCIRKGYCGGCNELNCIGNFSQVKIVNAIEKTTEEKQQLQEKYNIRSKAYNEVLLENASLKDKVDLYKEVIEEVREYLISYNSIHTIQFGTEEDSPNDIELNKELDTKTLTEMTHRYLMVHDKLLQILDKAKEN